MFLPPELLRHTVSYTYHHEEYGSLLSALYSDEEASSKDTLLACSRVSFAWRQATLPFLFHTLAVGVDSDTSRMSECSCRHCHELESLRDSSPAVYNHVHELRIRALCSDCRAFQTGADVRGAPSVELDGVRLLRALSRLKQLRSFSMQDIILSWNDRAPWSIDVRPVLSLESFCFNLSRNHYNVHVDIHDLEPLLRMFVRVGRMCFVGGAFLTSREDWGIEDDQDTHYGAFSHQCEVTSLVTKDCRQLGILLAFLKSKAVLQVSTLKSLELSLFDEDTVETAPLFLPSFAPDIISLTLHTSIRSFPLEWHSSPDGISKFTRLVHYTLRFNYKLGREAVAGVIHSLCGLRSLRLITLIIETDFDTQDALATSLGRSFMQPIEDAILELGSIQRVEIHLPRMREAMNYTSLVVEWTRAVLPRLHSDGVLA